MVEAGFPAGVVNIVTGGPQTGKAIVAHPGIDKIAFTGSTAVGKEIMRGAADTLKRVTLGTWGQIAQHCFCRCRCRWRREGRDQWHFLWQRRSLQRGSRLFLESKLKDEFTEKLVARASKMRPADPLDPKTRLGAIVSQEQMQTVLGFIEAGKKDGAKLIAGGNRVATRWQQRLLSLSRRSSVM